MELLLKAIKRFGDAYEISKGELSAAETQWARKISEIFAHKVLQLVNVQPEDTAEVAKTEKWLQNCFTEMERMRAGGQPWRINMFGVLRYCWLTLQIHKATLLLRVDDFKNANAIIKDCCKKGEELMETMGKLKRDRSINEEDIQRLNHLLSKHNATSTAIEELLDIVEGRVTDQQAI